MIVADVCTAHGSFSLGPETTVSFQHDPETWTSWNLQGLATPAPQQRDENRGWGQACAELEEGHSAGRWCACLWDLSTLRDIWETLLMWRSGPECLSKPSDPRMCFSGSCWRMIAPAPGVPQGCCNFQGGGDYKAICAKDCGGWRHACKNDRWSMHVIIADRQGKLRIGCAITLTLWESIMFCMDISNFGTKHLY